MVAGSVYGPIPIGAGKSYLRNIVIITIHIQTYYKLNTIASIVWPYPRIVACSSRDQKIPRLECGPQKQTKLNALEY